MSGGLRGAREAARRLEAADAKLQAAQGAERAEPLRLARLISAKLGLSPLEVALFAMLGGLVTTDPRAPEYGGIEIEPGKYAVGFPEGDHSESAEG